MISPCLFQGDDPGYRRLLQRGFGARGWEEGPGVLRVHPGGRGLVPPKVPVLQLGEDLGEAENRGEGAGGEHWAGEGRNGGATRKEEQAGEAQEAVSNHHCVSSGYVTPVFFLRLSVGRGATAVPARRRRPIHHDDARMIDESCSRIDQHHHAEPFRYLYALLWLIRRRVDFFLLLLILLPFR